LAGILWALGAVVLGGSTIAGSALVTAKWVFVAGRWVISAAWRVVQFIFRTIFRGSRGDPHYWFNLNTKQKFFYEIGQLWRGTELFRKYKDFGAVARGMALWRELGWRALYPTYSGLGGMTGFLKMLETGLSPLGRAFLAWVVKEIFETRQNMEEGKPGFAPPWAD